MSEQPVLHQHSSSKPVPRERPPRNISLFTQLTILNGGLFAQMGWFFLGLGLIATLVFGTRSEIKHIFAFDGEWVKTNGVLEDIQRTNAQADDRPVMRYVFSYYAEGEIRKGQSYSSSRLYDSDLEIGKPVEVEYKSKKPDRARIKGMLTEMFSAVVAFVFLFPIFGFLMLWFGMRGGFKMIRLLKEGEFTQGKLLNKKATGNRVNNRMVYAYEFTFQTETGKHIATCQTPHTHKVEDEEKEVILYLPEDPSISTVFDAIPGVPSIDPQGKLESAPTSNIKYLIAPTIGIFINLAIIITMFV